MSLSWADFSTEINSILLKQVLLVWLTGNFYSLGHNTGECYSAYLSTKLYKAFLGWKLFVVTYEASSVDFDTREMEFMF